MLNREHMVERVKSEIHKECCGPDRREGNSLVHWKKNYIEDGV